MNKSVMKCCICNNENIGQFITINNKKYHLCCIEQLQQENKKLNGAIQTYDILLKANTEENKKLKDNWNKLREYFNERIEVCDNRLSSPFCNFEKATKERLIFSQCLEKLTELEGSNSNE